MLNVTAPKLVINNDRIETTLTFTALQRESSFTIDVAKREKSDEWYIFMQHVIHIESSDSLALSSYEEWNMGQIFSLLQLKYPLAVLSMEIEPNQEDKKEIPTLTPSYRFEGGVETKSHVCRYGYSSGWKLVVRLEFHRDDKKGLKKSYEDFATLPGITMTPYSDIKEQMKSLGASLSEEQMRLNITTKKSL